MFMITIEERYGVDYEWIMSIWIDWKFFGLIWNGLCLDCVLIVV